LALRSFGFHFLSLANNHILDYCTQGLEETRQVSAGLGAPAVSC
jgi:poly-gamma-glutamate capsule biosynthesis protein CapA/YwtB (metallophosphatase superfamily)